MRAALLLAGALALPAAASGRARPRRRRHAGGAAAVLFGAGRGDAARRGDGANGGARPATPSWARRHPKSPRRGLRDFFHRFFDKGAGSARRRIRSRIDGEPAPIGLGSGFIIDPNGTIVTNFHVIEGADEITVVLDDGTELDAELVAVDDKTDIAVLRVEAGRRLPTVAWGDSSTVKVGDWAVAIGNPFGLGASVSVGVISAKGRSINAGPYDDYFQIDAPINRGNSGGPLFDQQGRVIGVNAAIFSPSGGNVGIGFAIPANQARSIVEELLEKA